MILLWKYAKIYEQKFENIKDLKRYISYEIKQISPVKIFD